MWPIPCALQCSRRRRVPVTNLDVASLTERFQTRFQPVRLQPPENGVLAAFLARRWGAPIAISRQIAEGAKGNVRAAMADLEMWMR